MQAAARSGNPPTTGLYDAHPAIASESSAIWKPARLLAKHPHFTNNDAKPSQSHLVSPLFVKDIYARTLAHSSYRGVASKIVTARCSKKSLVGTPNLINHLQIHSRIL